MDDKLLGLWVKQPGPACAEHYPDSLDIRSNGIYYGKQDTPGRFALWDVGVIEMVGTREVRVSVANDARLLYRWRVDGAGTLSFTDPDGCVFSYRRP